MAKLDVFGKALKYAGAGAFAYLLGRAVNNAFGVSSWWGKGIVGAAPGLLMAGAANFSTSTRPAVKYLIPAAVSAGVMEAALGQLDKWAGDLGAMITGRRASVLPGSQQMTGRSVIDTVAIPTTPNLGGQIGGSVPQGIAQQVQSAAAPAAPVGPTTIIYEAAKVPKPSAAIELGKAGFEAAGTVLSSLFGKGGALGGSGFGQVDPFRRLAMS